MKAKRIVMYVVVLIILLIGVLYVFSMSRQNVVDNSYVDRQKIKETTLKARMAETEKYFPTPKTKPDAFEGTIQDAEPHYVVRFGFNLEIPEWMAEHWNWSRYSIGNDEWDIDPNIDTLNAWTDHFSSIYIYANHSLEIYNAETLYTQEKERAFGVLTQAEVFLNKDEDIRIYHVQNEKDGVVYDQFFMDDDYGEKTVRVSFHSLKDESYRYTAKIKAFLQGFEKVSYPQG